MTATEATIAPAPRPSFAILVAISAIGPLALNMFIPSMPGLEKTFAVPYGTVQLTLTLYLIGMAVCQLIYGPASDKFGRRPLLLAGLSLFFIASVLAAIAPTIETLIAARLIQAIGGSAGIVLARAMVRDVFTREQSASMISYITMAFVVAPMIAPVLGGFFEQYASWRTGFWILAGFGAIVLSRRLVHLAGNPCGARHRSAEFLPQCRPSLRLAALPRLHADIGFYLRRLLRLPRRRAAHHDGRSEAHASGIRPVVHHHLGGLHGGKFPLGPLHHKIRH